MEAVMAHGGVSQQQAKDRAVEMFWKVNLPDPEKSLGRYPHQFSGGMKQRVMIAMALANNPKLLIADEPTTALDVSIQAQILSLIKEMQEEVGSSVIIISHDLGVIATMAEKVAVMYAGGIVEYGMVADIFDKPLHPYTRGLIGAIPRLDRDQEYLEIIPGNLPNLLDLPAGCKFRERCPIAMDVCAEVRPPVIEVEEGHEVACHAYS
jgi:oligopeptide/dipeptide ABC transporter ATP-binding protein